MDTPGHADFAFEVQRSLRVLDGAVVIMDGVAGVEAQTEKVWANANLYSLPRLVFVNKLDREGANMSRTIVQTEARLGVRTVVLQIPLYSGEKLQGIVDVITRKAYQFNSDDFCQIPIPGDMLSQTEAARVQVLETLSDLDEGIVEEFLEHGDNVPDNVIKTSIRKLTLANRIAPILCGASFRNIGIQPLLDAVVDYLPSPADKPQPLLKQGEKVVEIGNKTLALAFKVTVDPRRGPLTFVRIYGGNIKSHQQLYNTSTGHLERAMKLLQVQADELREIAFLDKGAIGAISGLKHTKTGDTLLGSDFKVAGAQLLPIPVPSPVFFTSVEPHSLGEAKGVEEALQLLLREDPSLSVRNDEETGQMILGGMGELHLEIAADRLRQLGAKCDLSRMRIGYRESLLVESGPCSATYERESTNSKIKASITLCVSPLENLAGSNEVKIDDISDSVSTNSASCQEIIDAIKSGVELGLAVSPHRGLPMHGVHVHVTQVTGYGSESTPQAYVGAALKATRSGLRTAIENGAGGKFIVLEPVMDVVLTVPESCMGQVLSDLTGVRGGQINDLAMEEGMGELDILRQINANVPLSAMRGYNSILRSLSAGRGSFSMVLGGWAPVSNVDAIKDEF